MVGQPLNLQTHSYDELEKTGAAHLKQATSLPEGAEVYCREAKKLCERKAYEPAEQLLNTALAIYRNHYGKTHVTVVTVLEELANIYTLQKKYTEAERLWMRAILIRTRTQGPEHNDTLQSLVKLGHVYLAQGKREDAETMYQRVLTNSDTGSEATPSVMEIALDSLATLYLEWSKEERNIHSERGSQNTPPLQSHIQDPQSPGATKILYNLAVLYVKQEKWQEAETLYKKILFEYDNTSREASVDFLQTLYELAFIYTKQGNFNEAESCLKRVLKASKQQENPAIATSLNSLAAVQIAQGKYEQAEHLLHQALTFGSTSAETGDVAVAMSLINLATLYLEQKKYEQVISLLSNTLTLMDQAKRGV